jgi:Zn-finger nucleic acid-binding protein
MNCPVCSNQSLLSTSLEPNLSNHQCTSCQGRWIEAAAYYQWLATLQTILPEKAGEQVALAALEEQRAKLCPRCRRIMLRYNVGHGLAFALDQCPACNGMWFDRDEWEALKKRNLHDEVNAIFTEAWQTAARKEAARTQLAALHQRKFGEKYDELLRMRAWLREHPQRDEVIAFLTDADPFST